MAAVNLGGRPREHNREQVAIDLIEWAKKPDSINLNKFCAYYEPIIPPSKMSLWAKEDDWFRQAYESAKMFLGFRREEWLNQERLHVKAYDLNVNVYDYFKKEESRDQSKFDASLTSSQVVKHEFDPQFKEHMDQLSALKHAEIKIKADTKS